MHGRLFAAHFRERWMGFLRLRNAGWPFGLEDGQQDSCLFESISILSYLFPFPLKFLLNV
jgi:hypothetical protein